MLQDWNGRVNLTRLVQGEDFWIAQVLDSLWPLLPELEKPETPRRCIDVGTVEDSQGLPWRLRCRVLHLTLVDSVGRKTAAVAAMATALGLSDRVVVRTERVERTGTIQVPRSVRPGHGAGCGCSTHVVGIPRAPASTAGAGPALSGPLAGQRRCRTATSFRSCSTHGPIGISRTELPADRGPRTLIRISAERATPKNYPRAIGVPTKLPLGGQADDRRS